MPAAIKTLLKRIPFLRGKGVVVAPLEGGLTNRNYCLKCDRDQFVLRIAGESSKILGIDRRVEHACTEAAFAAGIGPEVLAYLPQEGVMVTRFVEGTLLDSQALQSPATLRRVVRSLRRYHECPCDAGQFSAFETVRRYHAQARKRRVLLPPQVRAALKIMGRIEQALTVPDRVCPCHNDLLPANFIHDGRRVWILDWEYGGMGDLFFDLGNLAANNAFGEAQERQLLEYYFGKVRAADLGRLRLMRLASDLRESMWGFLQMGISKLDFDYQAYALQHLERFLKAAQSACSRQGWNQWNGPSRGPGHG